MTRNIITHVLCIGLLSAITHLNSPRANAAEKPASGESSTKEKKNSHPFRGKISAIDKTAMTITLEGKEKPRVVHVTSQTRIAKAGKPATLGDALVGEEVAGQASTSAAGSEEALSLRLGAKPEAEPKEKAKPAEKKEAKKAKAESK